jgi:hypothetical protein
MNASVAHPAKENIEADRIASIRLVLAYLWMHD